MSTPLARSEAEGDPGSPARLDLRGTPCPLNFIRSRLALEKIPPGAVLLVDLDRGEPEQMVADGLRAEGHEVGCEPLDEAAVRLRIRRDARRTGP